MKAPAKKKAKPLPKRKKLVLHVEPHHGVAMLAISIVPPKGYVFLRVDRTGTRAVVTFERMS